MNSQPNLQREGLKADLHREAESVKQTSIMDMFYSEPERLSKLTYEVQNLCVDFSKQKLSVKAFDLLVDYAKKVNLKAAMNEMASGVEINTTEKRKVLHMALRGSEIKTPKTEQARKDVDQARQKCRSFVQSVRSGEFRGMGSHPIRHILHIGIGGSDLGPRLVAEALMLDQVSEFKMSFVANIDPEEIDAILAQSRPEETLVVIVSKSFSTHETQMNGKQALEWYRKWYQKTQSSDTSIDEKNQPEFMKHFIAVTACPEKARAFGIASERIFEFQDWVGGRYSLWSSVGIGLEIALGSEVFEQMLSGAYYMDQHFMITEFEQNIPVLLALNDFWSRCFLGYETRAIIPYKQRLRLFPSYLQQLEMESNGKSAGQKGEAIEISSPIVWGGEGTNVQHAFFQLLHQGTLISPIHFIAVVKGKGSKQAENALLANCLAQSEALMRGRNEQETINGLRQDGLSDTEINQILPQKIFEGDRPSLTLLISELTPFTLGQLIALYEHKVFVESILWGVNAFDQWGVELGKMLAGQIEKELNLQQTADHDPSTSMLIKKIQES